MTQNNWGLSQGGQAEWKNYTKSFHKELSKFKKSMGLGDIKPHLPIRRERVEKWEQTHMWEPQGDGLGPVTGGFELGWEENAPGQSSVGTNVLVQEGCANPRRRPSQAGGRGLR